MSKSTIRPYFRLTDNARYMAIQVLHQCLNNEKHQSIRSMLDIYSSVATLKNIKKAQALVYSCLEGIVRYEYELQLNIHKKWETIDPLLRTTLLLGASLLNSAKTPPYAIIDDLCNFMKEHSSAHQGHISLLNAVLRSYQKSLPYIHAKKRYDLRFAIKPELIGYFKKSFGLEQTENILTEMTNPLPLYCVFRLTLSKSSPIYEMSFREYFFSEWKIFKDEIEKEGVNVILVENILPHSTLNDVLGLFVLDLKDKNLTSLKSFKEGRFFVQGLAAAKVASLCSPRNGEVVWDLCAAPGGKSFYAYLYNYQKFLYESWQNNEEIQEVTWLMSDISSKRLEKIEQNISRLNFSPNEFSLYCLDASNFDFSHFVNKVDWLICDVPCSGLGLLAQKPDIKWKMKHETIQNLISLQEQILNKSSVVVKKGGYLLYSTCTLNKQENETQIENFLKSENGKYFTEIKLNDLEKENESIGYTFLPTKYPTEGFYFCLLKKIF